MRARWILILAGCVLLVAVGLRGLQRASAGKGVRLNPPSETIPGTLFGMHIHHLVTGAPKPTPWPSIRFDTWRLWDAFVAWPNLEPEKGQWNLATLDRYVAMAKQHNVEILLPLAMSPAWASYGPKGPYGGHTAPPVNIADWQAYVRAVATRYRGRIHDYEIWNEPNSKTFYSGSTQEMVNLVRVAYAALKEVDRSNIVVSPAPTRLPTGLPWLKDFLKAGGGKYVDVIGFHFYVKPDAPESMLPAIEKVRQVMEQFGVGNKPLWDTETGWFIQNHETIAKSTSGNMPGRFALSQDQAAAYVARAYVLTWASGVSRLYWYAWDNGNMGLVEPDGRTLKEAAVAYGQVENWLVGATMTSCESNASGIWICGLTRPENYHAWIVWDPERTVSFNVPTAWKVHNIRDLSGTRRPIGKARSVEVGPSPILLVSP